MSLRKGLVSGSMLAAAALGVTPGQAFLFWTPPVLTGAPATADDSGLAMTLIGASPAERQANFVWTMRAGLNVAALQCQFAPALRTVANYNNLLRQHAAELQTTYNALSAYFKRTGGKTWQTKLDQYTTRTYNSFSTLDAQVVFCETAASIGRETMDKPKGALGGIATARLREFRNSLKPVGDAAFANTASAIGTTSELDTMPAEAQCVDKKGRPKKKC